MTFIVMRYFKVEANVVALSGIAIAIGVMVDVGIIFTENIVRHLEMPHNLGVKGRRLMEVIYESAIEVGSAIVTAMATIVVSFLPVFTMQAAEGKLFHPLAFTKTFAILSSLVLGIIIIPALAHLLFSIRFDRDKMKRNSGVVLIALGIFGVIFMHGWMALVLVGFGVVSLFSGRLSTQKENLPNLINIAMALIVVLYYLSAEWLPLGSQNSFAINFIFVVILIGLILGGLFTVVHYYHSICFGAWTTSGSFCPCRF